MQSPVTTSLRVADRFPVLAVDGYGSFDLPHAVEEQPTQFTQFGVLNRRDEAFMKQMERLADDLMRKSLQPALEQSVFPFSMVEGLGPPEQSLDAVELGDDDVLEPWEKKLRDKSAKTVDTRLTQLYAEGVTAETPAGMTEYVTVARPAVVVPNLNITVPSVAAATQQSPRVSSTRRPPRTAPIAVARQSVQLAKSVLDSTPVSLRGASLSPTKQSSQSSQPVQPVQQSSQARMAPLPVPPPLRSQSESQSLSRPMSIVSIATTQRPSARGLPAPSPRGLSQTLRYAEQKEDDALFHRAAIEHNVMSRVRRTSQRARPTVSR